jgi:hypothetical protein
MKDARLTRASPVDFDIPSVEGSTFSATWLLAGQTVVVRISGNADSDAAPTLARFLERLHREAQRTKVAEVVFDFRELYFLTASCIKYLVAAVERVAAADARSQYKVRLVTAPTLRWQEQTVEMLCQVAPRVVHVERA